MSRTELIKMVAADSTSPHDWHCQHDISDKNCITIDEKSYHICNECVTFVNNKEFELRFGLVNKLNEISLSLKYLIAAKEELKKT